MVGDINNWRPKDKRMLWRPNTSFSFPFVSRLLCLSFSIKSWQSEGLNWMWCQDTAHTEWEVWMHIMTLRQMFFFFFFLEWNSEVCPNFFAKVAFTQQLREKPAWVHVLGEWTCACVCVCVWCVKVSLPFSHASAWTSLYVWECKDSICFLSLKKSPRYTSPVCRHSISLHVCKCIRAWSRCVAAFVLYLEKAKAALTSWSAE